jgi:hypothetical protein
MSLCACMGPQRGDPYCYCEMHRRGLTPAPASESEVFRLREVLSGIFRLDTVTCLSCGAKAESAETLPCGH